MAAALPSDESMLFEGRIGCVEAFSWVRIGWRPERIGEEDYEPAQED
jgi:hypothetical protein